MSAYLYPELKSVKAYKEAITRGVQIRACENTPWGQKPLEQGQYSFEGPHYPKPPRYYGRADVVNGLVVKVT